MKGVAANAQLVLSENQLSAFVISIICSKLLLGSNAHWEYMKAATPMTNSPRANNEISECNNYQMSVTQSL